MVQTRPDNRHAPKGRGKERESARKRLQVSRTGCDRCPAGDGRRSGQTGPQRGRGEGIVGESDRSRKRSKREWEEKTTAASVIERDALAARARMSGCTPQSSGERERGEREREGEREGERQQTCGRRPLSQRERVCVCVSDLAHTDARLRAALWLSACAPVTHCAAAALLLPQRR